MFQSLVGTLKTFIIGRKSTSHNEFQSLVGTLKTHEAMAGVSQAGEFQSLVGTLKTRLNLNFFHVLQVSIPCRYAKNPATRRQHILQAQFQSLVGTLKTWFLSAL